MLQAPVIPVPGAGPVAAALGTLKSATPTATAETRSIQVRSLRFGLVLMSPPLLNTSLTKA
jgi:hypothetical protein